MVSPALRLDYNSWKEIFRFQVVKGKDTHVGGARPHNHTFKERAKSFAPDFIKVASKRHFWDMTKIGKRKSLDQGIMMVKVADAWQDGMLKKRERDSQPSGKRKGLRRQTDRLPDLMENKNRDSTGGTIKLSLHWCLWSIWASSQICSPRLLKHTHTEWHPRDRWRIYLDQFKEVP